MKKLTVLVLSVCVLACSSSSSDDVSPSVLNELVGNWEGFILDADDSPDETTFIYLNLVQDGTGSAVFEESSFGLIIETYNETFNWSATSSRVFLDYTNASEEVYDSETLSYNQVNNDEIIITDDEGDVSTLYRTD